MQISFCELRTKEVVNVYNGKRLGNIIDMIIDTRCARVLGIVVPNCNAKFSIFKPSSDIFIPYNNIIKIGKDVILVDLSNIDIQGVQNTSKKSQNKPQAKDDKLKDFEDLQDWRTNNSDSNSRQ